MLPRDLVYLGHMLGMARKAVAKVRGRGTVVRDHLGVDEDTVWQVVTADLPKLVESLEPLVQLTS